MVVVTPVNEVSIPRFEEPPVIVMLPPLDGKAVNLVKSNPYCGELFWDASVLNPTRVLSCQYLRTPVF